MKIKKGDKVQVIAGKDKGVTGEVLAVDKVKNQVVVEGVNIRKKAMKPTQANPDGGIQSQEAPIDASNVMLYDSKAKQAGRVGYVFENGEKIRINKKSGNKVAADKKKKK
jgi:large subunit ribosomal protein L24